MGGASEMQEGKQEREIVLVLGKPLLGDPELAPVERLRASEPWCGCETT